MTEVAALPDVRRHSTGKKFRCAKCKKYHLPKYKAIAQRRTGGPGIVPWCLGCVCNSVTTWEHPWHSAE